MSLITVITNVYNEEENVEEVYQQVKETFAKMPQHTYEHMFIDNASRDKTVAILRDIVAKDENVKVIVNNRNFGHIRSPYHALCQAKGDAVVLLYGDLQDPPALIEEFVKKWEEGNKVVLGVKDGSEESRVMFLIRKLYYDVLFRLADVELTKNNNGFGLYDRAVIDELRNIHDVYPYLRGLISDLGFSTAHVAYKQKSRRRGVTKNNFYTLYDMAMLGITSHTKVPIRLATIGGFSLCFLSLLVALGYFVAKLVFWNNFPLGMAPLIIGLFFFASVQLFFIGLLGEYISAIHTQVLARPIVVERERIGKF